MNLFPLWQMILKKKPEHLLDFRFEYTYSSKLKRYGDIYTTVLFHGILATYIIDFGADNSSPLRKYTPEYLIKNPKCLAEVLLFNRGDLLDDDIFEILAFNENHKIPVSITNLNGQFHNTSYPSNFNYVFDYKNQKYNREDEKYYIKGKEYDKNKWEIIRRSMKIDKIKQNVSDIL